MRGFSSGILGLVLLALQQVVAQSNGTATLAPQEVYDGGYTNAQDIRLKIGNGGAGQSGLIKAWADAYIKYCVESKQIQPFKVGWYLGDTTQSLANLATGGIDVAVTYNDAAEQQALASGSATQRVYGFRDHFYLVGPKATNPANLTESDDILVMFNKIVTGGNADAATPPADRPPVRFLSRFDKSATNIKEAQLFITIGQVPWAFAYSTWYHQYPRFPIQALQGAASLSEYTITDRGTWLSSANQTTDALAIFKAGSDDAADLLLNPARVLLGAKADPSSTDISKGFMDWVVRDDGGQQVIATFEKNGQALYSKAPANGTT